MIRHRCAMNLILFHLVVFVPVETDTLLLSKPGDRKNILRHNVVFVWSVYTLIL